MFFINYSLIIDLNNFKNKVKKRKQLENIS